MTGHLPSLTPSSWSVVCQRIVIVEWLGAEDQKTGLALFNWFKADVARCSGRHVRYVGCHSKAAVLRALRDVAMEVKKSGLSPLLHIEAHGDDDPGLIPRGYTGQDQFGNDELLTWDELRQPLCEINIASKCNLLLVSAACWGHAALFAACKGDRLPFVSIAGPSTKVTQGRLLDCSKEFYRRLRSTSRMDDIVIAADRELTELESFDWDAMPLANFEAMEELIKEHSTPEMLRERALNMAMKMKGDGIVNLSTLPYSVALDTLHRRQPMIAQELWNKRFMIDLYPENAKRFAFDAETFVRERMNQLTP